MNDERIQVDIGNCARCDNDHEKLEFNKFKKNGVHQYSHWATCPTTGEPVLVKIINDESNE